MKTRRFFLDGILCFLDRIHFFIAVQHGLGTLPLQASLGNHVDECPAIADVPICPRRPQSGLARNGVLHNAEPALVLWP